MISKIGRQMGQLICGGPGPVPIGFLQHNPGSAHTSAAKRGQIIVPTLLQDMIEGSQNIESQTLCSNFFY